MMGEDLSYMQEDWIGLKQLNDTGRLTLDECPGRHMQFSLSWLEDNILVPYFSQVGRLA